MTITIDGANGITTPDLTSAAPMDVGGSAVLTTASSLASANLTGTVASGRMPAGSVLQVVHTAKTNTFVGTSTQTGVGYFIDVTGLSATITPLSSTSKILVIANMYFGSTTTSSGYQQSYRLKKSVGGVDSFPILGDAEGGRPRATGRVNNYSTDTASSQYRMVMFNGTHQDTAGSTSSITYQAQLGGYSGSPVVYVNRSENFQILANDYDAVPVSTLTLMEIAA